MYLKITFLLGAILIFAAFPCNAQITLERTFETPKDQRMVPANSLSHDIGIVNFENLGEKIYFMDFNIFQMQLYNMDSTLFDTITADFKLDPMFFWDTPLERFKVLGLSQYLFDRDDGIEFFVYLTFTPRAFSHAFAKRARYYVVDSDGSILLKRTGSRVIAEPKIQDSETGARLFLPITNYKTEIYQLPGRLGQPPIEPEEPIALTDLQEGDHVTLQKVLFDQSSAVLKPAAFEELRILVEVMKANTKMEILLAGHTDNQGSAAENMKLSIERVEEVKKYLVNKGIKAKRIKTKGFGETRPVASNKTEEQRKKNRRVELVVLRI